MFVDRARIHIKAGDGGNGCEAFRREKYVPRGGPSGGDGGDGGDVVLVSTPHENSLVAFRFRQHFKAQRGAHGSGNKRSGKRGDDIEIQVPVGTQVFDLASRELLFDFVEPGVRFLAASGGKGGRGNAVFATSTNQAPRKFEYGKPGQTRELLLELKVLADVGLIGYPNAGKSTLISVVSEAKPKIADYPFTTLTPHLGVVSMDDFRSFIIADIPGLIEGAHGGTGLGDHFLRHVERCRILVHLVDISGMGPNDPGEAILAINRELELYDPSVGNKKQVLVASKLDSADTEKLDRLRGFCRSERQELFEISAVTKMGVKELVHHIDKLLQDLKSCE